MPTIAPVAGCAIRFYYEDHEPAHFHVAPPGGGGEAVVRIANLSIMQGELAPAHRRAVLGHAEATASAEAATRQAELPLAWLRCREGVNPGRIP